VLRVRLDSSCRREPQIRATSTTRCDERPWQAARQGSRDIVLCRSGILLYQWRRRRVERTREKRAAWCLPRGPGGRGGEDTLTSVSRQWRGRFGGHFWANMDCEQITASSVLPSEPSGRVVPCPVVG